MHQGTDSWDFVRVTCPVTSLRTLPAFLPRALPFVAASHVTLRTLLALLPRALRFVAASHVTLRTLLALLPRALRCVAAAILVRFFGFVSRIFFSGSAAAPTIYFISFPPTSRSRVRAPSSPSPSFPPRPLASERARSLLQRGTAGYNPSTC